MSNLATMIMEGSNYGGFRANLTHSYDHEDGAALIAMESAEALRDIFEAEFYVPNTCTIKAALEGASCVEESSQAAIMEASVKGAFAKIKEFFINLKNKVIEFLHNIKRYLTGIFGNDEKWVKNYETELKALKKSDLKDYKIKMYTYTIDDVMTKDELAKELDTLKSITETSIEKIIVKNTYVNKNDEVDSDEINEEFDKLYLGFIKDLTGQSIDPDELDKAIWSKLRNGADNESDKDDVDVSSNMSTFISTLKSANKTLGAYDTAISKTNEMYNKAIKLVNDAENKLNKIKENDKGNYNIDLTGKATREYKDGHKSEGVVRATATPPQMSNINTTLRAYSSYISKMQTAENKMQTAAKSAIVERNKAYKQALTGAFAYARKNKKK